MTISDNRLKVLISCALFMFSAVVYSYPVYLKGYAPSYDFTTLAPARNVALAGTYRTENENGVFLSAAHARDKGKPMALINPLTPVIYGELFSITGVNDYTLRMLPLVASVALSALATVLLFLVVSALTDVSVGFASAIVAALLPFRLILAITPGMYEFAAVFFILATWLYLGAKQGPFKAGANRLFFAGIFFALAALARNAFAISFIPFLLYDFYKNRRYVRSLALLLPFLILFGSTLTSFSWLGTDNGYLTGSIEQQPFTIQGEVFRDPYTFYYDRAHAAHQLQGMGTALSSAEVYFLGSWGYPVTIAQRISGYLQSVIFYIKQTVTFTGLGGPMIVLFILIGGYRLYYTRRDLLQFFGIWFLIWFVGLIYMGTQNWDHFQEIVLVIVFLAGLGISYVIELATVVERRNAVFALVIVCIAGHLFYADWWRLYDTYHVSHQATPLAMLAEVGATSTPETIAVGDSNMAYALNYFTDRDTVYFNPATIAELTSQGHLKSAFAAYHIGSAVSFSPEVLQSIHVITDVPVVQSL